MLTIFLLDCRTQQNYLFKQCLSCLAPNDDDADQSKIKGLAMFVKEVLLQHEQLDNALQTAGLSNKVAQELCKELAAGSSTDQSMQVTDEML